jgi:flagellar hook protein FlgE
LPVMVSTPPAGTDTGILITNKTTNNTMTTTQPTPTNFDQTITYTTTGAEASLDEIAGLIASRINANGQVPVTASAAGGVLTITGNSDTVSFLTDPNALPGQTPANIGLTFGGTLSDGSRGNPGALTAINMSKVGTGNATSSALRDPGDPAQISFQVDYGDGPQSITLDVGRFNDNRGLTQFQGDDINVTSLLQDGSPQGTFQNVEITSNGDVVANYDNGRRRTIARIPIILFNNPNALSRDSGNVFTETVDSGRARFNDVGLNGAGTLVASSLEGSNVDIADEFTKLIVAQRSYTANTRVITTTDEMLTDTLNMKR